MMNRRKLSVCSRVVAAAVVVGAVAVGAPTSASAVVVPAPTIEYNFSGNLTDSKSASTLTPAGACEGDPCNDTATFGSDADGNYWAWTSSNARGGGLTLLTNSKIGDEYTIRIKFLVQGCLEVPQAH